MQNEIEFLNVVVEHITFRNASNGFTVCTVSCHGEKFTAVGIVPDISKGETLEMTGNFVMHPTYGKQLKILSVVKLLPSGESAILKYLSSGAVKGIGPATAKRIVARFGEKTFEVISENPEKLSEIQGISFEKALAIVDEFSKKKSLRELCVSLAPIGISTNEAIKIFEKMGNNAAEKISQNPYELCFNGLNLSFSRVEEIAEKMDIENDCDERICAGLIYVLKHNLNNGHTFIPREKVVDMAIRLLEIDSQKVDDGCEILIDRMQIVSKILNSQECVALKSYADSEIYVSNRLKTMLLFKTGDVAVSESEIHKTEMENEIEFDPVQKQAINSAVSENLLVLTGGPGTGKTTTVNGIIEVLKNRKMKVLLAAPTGRAAKRMTELTGVEAKTIHRLLEVASRENEEGFDFGKNEKNPLDADAVIVDEMSMVDIKLFERLLRALPLGCRLIMVGDSDQLPSVGAGNVLNDIISSGKFKTVRLTKIFRQAMESLIVTNAHKIIAGEKAILNRTDSDFFMLNQMTAEKVAATVAELYLKRLPEAYGFSPFDNIQIICPSKMYETGTVYLNNLIQQQLNPPEADKPEVSFGGTILRKGDRVMQVKNNYDIIWKSDNGEYGAGVFNGDVGILVDIDAVAGSASVQFDERLAEYTGDQVMQLDLAYAITIHKSQGSEFDAVVLPVFGFPSKLCYRNLLYTAVTRAKKMMIAVGNQGLLQKMAENDRKTLRYTALKCLLEE